MLVVKCQHQVMCFMFKSNDRTQNTGAKSSDNDSQNGNSSAQVVDLNGDLRSANGTSSTNLSNPIGFNADLARKDIEESGDTDSITSAE